MPESISIKKFECGFTQIPNVILNDPNLSIKAKQTNTTNTAQ